MWEQVAVQEAHQGQGAGGHDGARRAPGPGGWLGPLLLDRSRGPRFQLALRVPGCKAPHSCPSTVGGQKGASWKEPGTRASGIRQISLCRQWATEAF